MRRWPLPVAFAAMLAASAAPASLLEPPFVPSVGAAGGGGGGGSGDVESVYLCLSGDCSTLTAGAGDSLNLAGADLAIPSTGSTSLPGTCSEGQLHRDTDSGGTETYVCTAANTWTKVLAASDFDTIAELDAIVADANVIDATEIDSVAEVETLAGGVNLLTATEIDTIAELDALVAENLIVSTEIDTLAELEALMAAINIIASTEIDSIGELETLLGAVNVILSTEIDTEAELQALLGGINLIVATEIDQASEILAPWTGTKTASTFPDGGGAMRPIGAALEAANCAAVTTPASGYSQLFRNTTDGFDYLKDDGGNCEPIATYVDGSLPSNLALLRFKGSQVQEVPGSSCADTGVCTAAGFVATGGNPWSVTAHVNDGAVGTAKNCARFDAPGSFDHDAGTADTLLSAMPVNQANDLSFRFLTVTLNSWQTDANFVADEEVSFVIRTCTLDATPTAGDCTTRDKIVFEGDSSALGSYGTSRTNIACATRPCQGTIALDGNGVSPQGTVTFAAGTVDYWVICWENDDAEWTADLTSAPGTFDATFKVDLVD